MAGESAHAVAVRRRAKAEALLRSADPFERGAVGDVRTAQALAALPSMQWRSFRDVSWPGRRFANIDHVMVGPSGVFVIDALAWSGDVSVTDGVLRQNRRRRDRVVTRALNAASAVADLLPIVDPGAVQPVLCLDRDDALLGWSREVMVCSTANVATMISSRPTVLDERAVAGIAEVLATMLRAANDPVAPVSPAQLVLGRRSRPATATEQKRQRVRSAVSIVLTGAALVLALTFGFPHVAPAVDRLVNGAGIATVALGAPHTVRGNPVRPELVLQVDSVAPTRPARGVTAPADGALVAAKVVVRNTGFKAWSSEDGLRFRLVDAAERSHDQVARLRPVRAGRALPPSFTLEPGRAARGVVVFEVPAGFAATTVHARVGPGLLKTVAWGVAPTAATR